MSRTIDLYRVLVAIDDALQQEDLQPQDLRMEPWDHSQELCIQGPYPWHLAYEQDIKNPLGWSFYASYLPEHVSDFDDLEFTSLDRLESCRDMFEDPRAYQMGYVILTTLDKLGVLMT